MINFKKYLVMNNKIRVSLASSDFFYFFYCVSVKMGNSHYSIPPPLAEWKLPPGVFEDVK